MVKLLGVDPGLRFTGWGVIEADGNRLRHVADGVIATDNTRSVPERLKALHDALVALMAQHRPDEAAIEETYVNRNGTATLKLGYARGVALLAPALVGIPVTEYGAKSVKLAVVGTGGAEKAQVQMMVRRLLPTLELLVFFFPVPQWMKSMNAANSSSMKTGYVFGAGLKPQASSTGSRG